MMTFLKNKMMVLSVAAATLALGACSQCPSVDSHYGQFPYNNERTAGTGTAVYGGNCKVQPKVVAAPVVVEKKAEAVFTKTQRK